jgi:hypothetical protein
LWSFDSTPHPGPLLVWRGEGELFCGTITQDGILAPAFARLRRGKDFALGYYLSGFQPYEIAKPAKIGFTQIMSTVEQIKDDMKRLSKADQKVLLDWLTSLLENELELTDEFKAEIERGEADIAAGRIHIVESDSARKERFEKFFTEWDATHSVSVSEKPNRERTYSDDEPS